MTLTPEKSETEEHYVISDDKVLNTIDGLLTPVSLSSNSDIKDQNSNELQAQSDKSDSSETSAESADFVLIEEVNGQSEDDHTEETEVLLNEGSEKYNQIPEVDKPEQESYVAQYVEDLSDSADEMINELGQKIVNEVMQDAVIELEEQLKNEAEEIDDDKLIGNKILITEETITEEEPSTTNSEPLVDVIDETDQKPSTTTNEHANQSTEVVSNETGLSDNILTITQSNTETNTEMSQPDLDSTTAVNELSLEESVTLENVKEETVAELAEEHLITDESTFSEQLDEKDQQSVGTSSMAEKVEEVKDEPIETENSQDKVTEDEAVDEKFEIGLENETVNTDAIVAVEKSDEPTKALEALTTEINESESQTVTKASNAKLLGINETSSALAYITLMLNDCAIEKSLQNFRNVLAASNIEVDDLHLQSFVSYLDFCDCQRIIDQQSKL